MDPLRTKSYEKLWSTPPTVAVLLSALWMGPVWARCKLGFDRKPRSITNVMNLGLLDAAI